MKSILSSFKSDNNSISILYIGGGRNSIVSLIPTIFLNGDLKLIELSPKRLIWLYFKKFITCLILKVIWLESESIWENKLTNFWSLMKNLSLSSNISISLTIAKFGVIDHLDSV